MDDETIISHDQSKEDRSEVALYDVMPVSYQSLDSTGNILSVNEAWLAMLGYSRDEVLGKWLGSFLIPEAVDVFRDRFAQFCSEGNVNGAEMTMLGRDGRRVLVSITGKASYDDDGNVIRTHCIVNDITITRKANKELEESEHRFRGLFESSIDGIVYLDTDGSIKNANAAFCAMLGSSREFVLGKNARDLVWIDDDNWQSFLDSMREAVVSRKEVSVNLHHAEGYRVPAFVRFWIPEDRGGVWVMIRDISEPLRTEDALRRSESQYRRIVETANEGIIGVDVSLSIVFSNQVLADFLGYGQAELLGRPLADMLPPESEGMASAFDMQGGKDRERFECQFQRKDGTIVWGFVSLSRLKSESGETTGCFAMIADINEHKLVEGELRRSRAVLSEVERVAKSGGWVLNLETGKVSWTDGMCRLHGVEPGYDMQGIEKYVKDFVHPDDWELVLNTFRTTLARGKTGKVTYRAVAPEGGYVIHHSFGVPDAGDGGVVKRIFGSNRDVTLEHNAAKELEQAHQRLLAILDGIEADVCVSTIEEGEILFMNEHMRESYEVTEFGHRCREVFRQEGEPCLDCPKLRLFDENGDPVETLVSERYNKKRDHWFLNHDRAIEWLEGRMVHMHMAADITDLKKMEEELTKATADAEAANVAKNEFLANMSHEIRTPLNGLLGMLQVLKLTSLAEEQYDYLNTALDSGHNLMQVLNDILDLSKVESGMLAFDISPMELGEVLNSVVSLFRHTAESRGVSMSWEIDESLHRHFRADKGRIRQVLFNLVGNAAKFTDTGSVKVEAYPLQLPTKDGKTRIFFRVTDTGIGIPEDKIGLMFDPFTQVDGSISRKYQGTGLGLGIVQRLVTMMDGTIAVSSEEGKGTSIIFTVALEPCDGPAHLPESGRREEGKPLAILVAEDEHVNRMVVQRLLSKCGYEPTCVETGEKAVELLQSGKTFDCVLTDIQMPGMDGVDTARTIREELKLDIPVIALTAHAMKGDQRRFMEAGMSGYIAKPFTMEELQAEIERVLAVAAI